MSDKKLKPCPMCEAAWPSVQVRWIGFTHTHNGAFSAGYRGECCDCGLTTRAFDNEDDAVNAWNTRATHGTLTAEQVREAIERHSIESLGCRRQFRERDWQAIADELNAELGSGTCHMSFINEYEYPSGDESYLCECSECGSREWEPAHDLPLYCRKCGAKVVS